MNGIFRSHMSAKIAVASLLAALAAFLAGGTAQAHAVPIGSSPEPGQVLAKSPATVTIFFNEAPDPALSHIYVLDAHQHHYEVGGLQARPQSATALSVAVRNLPKGVYTVAWEAVASDDGHHIRGNYSFGVAVAAPPPSVSQEDSSTSALSPLAGIARGVYYAALVLSLGIALVVLVVAPQSSVNLKHSVAVLLVVALGAAVAITQAQMGAASVGWGQLAHTTLFPSLLSRALPLVGGLAAAGVLFGPAERYRHLVPASGALMAAISALGDSIANHASTEGVPALSVLLQWVHIMAVGLWVGGAAVMLYVIRTVDSDTRATVVKKFAEVSVICMAVIVGTGVFRSLAAIGSWHSLFTTLYGWIVVAKIVLVAIMAALGLRIRRAIASGSVTKAFAVLGKWQVGVGACAIALSAALVNVAPPSVTTTALKGPMPIIADGTDGNTYRVHLEVSPGKSGFNNFTMRVSNYSEGSPVSGVTVFVSFLDTNNPSLGTSSLRMLPGAAGSYTAIGGNLGFAGTWNLTVDIKGGQWEYEVPLLVTVRK